MAERSSISSSSRIPWDTQATIYSLLGLPTTSMADGNVGRASTDRHKQVKHQPKGAQVSVGHRDFNGVDSGGREARRRAGRSEALAAGFLPELGKMGSAGSFRVSEHAVNGPGGGWVTGEADAAHWGGEKRVSAVNFVACRCSKWQTEVRRPVERLLTRVEKARSFHVSERRRQAGRCVAVRTHAALHARRLRGAATPVIHIGSL